MKALLGALAIGIMVAAQPAAARPWSGGFAPMLQAQGQRDPRDMRRDKRDMRRDQRMAPQRMAPERDERARGRLTDEERQDLRRDIDKANREIYRRRQQR
jgi:hypothetical protein